MEEITCEKIKEMKGKRKQVLEISGLSKNVERSLGIKFFLPPRV